MDAADDNIDWREASDSLKDDIESRTPYTDAVKCKKPVNHVKRPMNPFMIWSQIERRKIMDQNPGIPSPEISVQLGKRWKMLTNQERIPFAKEAERLRKLHSQEFPDYKFSPKPKKKKTPKLKADLKFSKNKRVSTPGNLEKSDEKFIARNNLVALKDRIIEKCESVDKSGSKFTYYYSKPATSVSSDIKEKLENPEEEKFLSLESEQIQAAGTSKKSSKKVSRKNKFSKITTEGKLVWDSLMEVDIATLSSKKTLPPRLQIDGCLTSGSIAALSCYRDDWAAAFDYLTDKVLQSSKNICEEIDNISKQYGEALEGKNNAYLTEPLEFNIPDINKELGKKWKDPNFGLKFST
ncbi:transcription factor SOX-11 [Parasteatoda tepidariorum]|uniref:transcription factor SOX-11 n=1 Tax=Parasteatoda tepidariorum TaxID=114398 RepID=UPI00077FA3C1|nr:transcription factor SOX-11 [Parasteatoda tepidariorum]